MIGIRIVLEWSLNVGHLISKMKQTSVPYFGGIEMTLKNESVFRKSTSLET